MCELARQLLLAGLWLTMPQPSQQQSPPSPPPSPPPPSPPVQRLSILSGLGCSNAFSQCGGCDVNQVYEARGQTADGRTYFQGVTSTGVWLFFDSNCGGGTDGASWRTSWFLGCQAPSTTASSNLQVQPRDAPHRASQPPRTGRSGAAPDERARSQLPF
jgi:hypothetical protein